MRDPHVRFCERHGGVILRAYSTAKPDQSRRFNRSICFTCGSDWLDSSDDRRGR